MPKAETAELKAVLETVVSDLPKVAWKRMFGCDAVFVEDRIFGLIWKEGRIGVKLTEASKYEELLSQDGAKPWKAGPMTMSNWVLVPETYHAKKAALKKWAALAHELARSEPEKKKAKPKTKTLAKSSNKAKSKSKGN